MFDQRAILHADDVCREPIRGESDAREPAVDDHEVALRHDHSRLILQRRGDALDQVEEFIPARRDMCAVLDVIGRLESLRRRIVAFVEEGLERVEDDRFVVLCL